MPAAEPKKRNSQRERLAAVVQDNVSVLEKKPRSEREPEHTIERQDVREALRRNRQYGDLPLTMIEADPDQVRKVNTESESFQELLASVREHGVIEPITVRWREDRKKFQIITGERRFRAATAAGLETMAAIVRDISDTDKAIHQLVENIQRENMNPVEEARAFKRYLVATDGTQDQLAKRIGKSKSYVSRTLALLEKLTREEQAELAKVAGPQLPGRSLLFEAVSIPDREVRLAILRGELTWDDAREHAKAHAKRKGTSRSKMFLRRFSLEQPEATVTVSFRKGTATPSEVGEALMEAYKQHENGPKKP